MARVVRVKVKGGEALAKKLEAMGTKAGRIMEDAALAGAEVIRAAASENAAKGPYATGELAGHIVAEVSDADRLRAEVSVGPDKDAFYGPMVEFGHALVRGKRGAKRVIGSVPPHPFLRPALDESKQQAKAKVTEEIRKRLEL